MNNLFKNKKNRIGRNNTCYCGSGKKYKKCCLDKDKSHRFAVNYLINRGIPEDIVSKSSVEEIMDVLEEIKLHEQQGNK